ncbi:hypothetical protein GTR02_03635 [Kineococcus sp. R8]|nr:hypothetical protein [Kineococcus siccus]
MHRGMVRLANVDPVRASEGNTPRPAVVVSDDRANAAPRQGSGDSPTAARKESGRDCG